MLTDKQKEIALKYFNSCSTEEIKELSKAKREEVLQYQIDNGFKKYLLKEGRESFHIFAKDKKDAEVIAELFNAVVIRVLK